MDFGNLFWWPFAAALGGFAIIIGILILIFWIWMIVDVAKRKFKNDVERVLWILIVVLGGWLGALIYFIIIRMYNPKGLAKK